MFSVKTSFIHTAMMSGILLLMSCIPIQRNNKNMEKNNKAYDYSCMSSAADGYPVDFLPGSYVGQSMVTPGFSRSSWGLASNIMVSGDGSPMSAPRKFSVTYFAYTEDKFYRAQDSLPTAWLDEKLSSVYTTSKGKERRYTHFIASAAPGGCVGLWLSGHAGQLLVGTYQAEEIELDYSKVFPQRTTMTREEINHAKRSRMYPFVQEEIRTNDLPYDYWKSLDTKFVWNLVYSDPEFEAYKYQIKFVNEEDHVYESDPQDWLTGRTEKTVPRKLWFVLKHEKDPIRYAVTIEVVKAYDPKGDEAEQAEYQMQRTDELISLFGKFYKFVGEEEVSLLVEFNDEMTDLKLKLKTATKELEIPGCTIRICDSEHYLLDY